jgi:hypothetical protein
MFITHSFIVSAHVPVVVNVVEIVVTTSTLEIEKLTLFTFDNFTLIIANLQAKQIQIKS